MYSIKAITTLTGLTAETLRAWERRYQGILPARSENGRRQYSAQDLEKLSLLAELTRSGHAISKIVGLDREALRELQRQAEPDLHASSRLIGQLMSDLMDYRIDRCEQLLKRALLACGTLDYVREILLPALNKVGELWHQQQISIAQEHMFSGCVKRIVLSLVSNQSGHAAASGPAMLFATPSGEAHEFGILVSCLLAAAQGFRCYYLGADLPGPDIRQAIERLNPDIVVMGLVRTPVEITTRQQLDILCHGDAQRNPLIWLGGEGACQLATRPPNCEVLEDIDGFYRTMQQWLRLNNR